MNSVQRRYRLRAEGRIGVRGEERLGKGAQKRITHYRLKETADMMEAQKRLTPQRLPEEKIL